MEETIIEKNIRLERALPQGIVLEDLQNLIILDGYPKTIWMK